MAICPWSLATRRARTCHPEIGMEHRSATLRSPATRVTAAYGVMFRQTVLGRMVMVSQVSGRRRRWHQKASPCHDLDFPRTSRLCRDPAGCVSAGSQSFLSPGVRISCLTTSERHSTLPAAMGNESSAWSREEGLPTRHEKVPFHYEQKDVRQAYRVWPECAGTGSAQNRDSWVGATNAGSRAITVGDFGHDFRGATSPKHAFVLIIPLLAVQGCRSSD